MAGREIPEERFREAARAIEAVRDEVRWKPEKDVQHLEKRKALDHLPQEATLDDYNSVIQHLVARPEHRVYLYTFGERHYYGVRGTWDETEWLALFNTNGLMETAFPPSRMEEYLQSRGFVELGTVREVMA